MIALRRASAAVAGAVLLATGAARADDPEAAHAAYDRGTRAFEAKRYLEAATELARADALAPSRAALGAALKVAALADDAVLAMTLADRAELRPGAGDELVADARKLRDRFAARAGKLSIRCAAVRACSATVDADPFPVEQQRWVSAGPHAVAIGGGPAAARYTVTVEGGKTLDWQEPAPAALPPPAVAPAPVVVATPPPVATPSPVTPPPPPAGGLSPAWFWVGLGAGAVLGGISIASGVDTLSKHSAFESGTTNDPTSGQAAQLRTNVLLGVTGGVALATAAVGVFAVRWSASAPVAATALQLSPGGAALRGRF